MFILLLKLPYPNVFLNDALGRCTTYILWLQVSWSVTFSSTKKYSIRWFLRPLTRQTGVIQLDRQQVVEEAHLNVTPLI